MVIPQVKAASPQRATTCSSLPPVAQWPCLGGGVRSRRGQRQMRRDRSLRGKESPSPSVAGYVEGVSVAPGE